MICPQCKCDTVTKTNKFGDVCFRQHKMASITDLENPESELKQDYRLGYDGYKYPLWQIDCPMSNQPVDSL